MLFLIPVNQIAVRDIGDSLLAVAYIAVAFVHEAAGVIHHIIEAVQLVGVKTRVLATETKSRVADEAEWSKLLHYLILATDQDGTYRISSGEATGLVVRLYKPVSLATCRRVRVDAGIENRGRLPAPIQVEAHVREQDALLLIPVII